MASNEAPARPSAKRDALRSIETSIQERWEVQKIFEEDAGLPGEPKYMSTFPYPYMNGRLHLGHAFSLSKVEFAVGYFRLKGRRCLFPFGFHCTGMPIKACADKLARQIADGVTPDTNLAATEAAQAAAAAAAATAAAAAEMEGAPAAKSKGKKSKAAAKAGGETNQGAILRDMGVPLDEIPNFRDPQYWLKYFPPLAVTDLKAFGAHVDFRRSFITTDVNPYYDSFVRWQFNRLRDAGKVKFGKRHTIFSAADGQPCADHDRQSGEGVTPQEYTVIKLEVQQPFPAIFEEFKDRKVFLCAATLRPETMYGQTNCWVGPDLEYGAFEMRNNEVFICTERAARSTQYVCSPTCS